MIKTILEATAAQRSVSQGLSVIESHWRELTAVEKQLVNKAAIGVRWDVEELTLGVWYLFDEAKLPIWRMYFETPKRRIYLTYKAAVETLQKTQKGVEDTIGAPPKWSKFELESFPKWFQNELREDFNATAHAYTNVLWDLGVLKTQVKLRRKMTRRSEAF